MKRALQVWRAMPRTEKIGAIAFPPVFMGLFWAVYSMLPN